MYLPLKGTYEHCINKFHLLTYGRLARIAVNGH